MKITVSGWPGGGSSTLTLLLAKELGLKHLQGGETFRFLGEKLNFKDTGIDRVTADKFLEEDFGHLYDKFIDYVLMNEEYNNIIIESDIASFRVGKLPTVLSIFLVTSQEARRQRVVIDGRTADLDILKKRDEENARFYRELHSIEWFDLELIRSKHQLVMENSAMPISDELKLVYERALEMNYISEEEKIKLVSQTVEEEKNFFKNGKEWYNSYLEDHNLVIPPKEILKIIVQEFSSDFGILPTSIKELIMKQIVSKT